MNHKYLTSWFLRVGLAFVFVYATVEIYIHPSNFLKYIPDFALEFLPVNIFLHIFGAFELILAGWLISNWKVHFPALISVLLMVGIVICNLEHFAVLFRNVAIATGGAALFFLEREKPVAII